MFCTSLLPRKPTAHTTKPTGGRTTEGFFEIRGGLESAIARGLAYAPYADLVWFETGEPSLEEATAFAKVGVGWLHAEQAGGRGRCWA